MYVCMYVPVVNPTRKYIKIVNIVDSNIEKGIWTMAKDQAYAMEE